MTWPAWGRNQLLFLTGLSIRRVSFFLCFLILFNFLPVSSIQLSAWAKGRVGPSCKSGSCRWLPCQHLRDSRASSVRCILYFCVNFGPAMRKQRSMINCVSGEPNTKRREEKNQLQWQRRLLITPIRLPSNVQIAWTLVFVFAGDTRDCTASSPILWPQLICSVTIKIEVSHWWNHFASQPLIKMPIHRRIIIYVRR